MNLGTLKTHVINRTGNDAIDSVLTQFVNQVEYDICSRYPFSWRLSLPVSLTCIPNQAYLNPSAYLPNFGDPWDAIDAQTPRKMLFIPVWDINRADPEWSKTSSTRTGVPTHYNIDWPNQRLWLYPIPDQAYPICVRYLKNPPEISNTSSSLFVPSQFHHVVAAGVESLAWQLDEDLQSSQAANTRYENGISRMIELEQQKPDYQPIFQTMENVVDYSDPFLEI
ncbi:MAG: hypothetical protein EHM30_10755 [Desulfobacteraceae bacterium]|nr:MAG: hypothetical protein EHM30_10755 [Desulfobacteraceae bacterium]